MQIFTVSSPISLSTPIILGLMRQKTNTHTKPMKTTKFLTSAFVLGSIALGTLGQAKEAAAANIVKTYEAHEAETDQYSKYGGGHAFWIPNDKLSPNFKFDGDADFNLFDDGTANLKGNIVAGDKKLAVDVWFNHKPEHDIAKLELIDSAYTKDGGPINIDLWKYYNIDSNKKSTLTEIGNWYEGEDQEVFSITDRSEIHIGQFGEGASGKNLNMGFSHWFWVTDEQGEVKGNDVKTYHGDINIDLIEVPEPATMSLLTLGLLGTGMGALKRKNK